MLHPPNYFVPFWYVWKAIHSLNTKWLYMLRFSGWLANKCFLLFHCYCLILFRSIIMIYIKCNIFHLHLWNHISTSNLLIIQILFFLCFSQSRVKLSCLKKDYKSNKNQAISKNLNYYESRKLIWLLKFPNISKAIKHICNTWQTLLDQNWIRLLFFFD